MLRELGLSWEMSESAVVEDETQHGDLSVRIASLELSDSLSHFMQDWQTAAERRIDARENISNTTLHEAAEGEPPFRLD